MRKCQWGCLGFPPHLSGFSSQSRVAVLQPVLQLLGLTCRSPKSGAFANMGQRVKQAPWMQRGAIAQGMGTAAFMEPVWRCLPVLIVVCVFKIGSRFTRLLTCVLSMLAYLQPSIPAALTRGAASRSAFSSLRTDTSASASRATSWRGTPSPVKVSPTLPAI